MHEIAFMGLRARYESWGSGVPVVLLHSGGSSSAQWAKIAERLQAEFRLIVPDLLGFGATEPWPVAGELTHELQAELVAAVIRNEGGGPADVVGHSYGGATAVCLQRGHADLVRSMMLIEPIIMPLLREAGDPLYESAMQTGTVFIASVDEGHPERGWERFIDSRNGAGTWARMSERGKARFLAQSMQTKEGFLSNRNNTTTLADCRAIDVPTTIVCGALTTPEDRRVTEILQAQVPRSRYEVIPEAGHMSPLTHPEAVADLIRGHVGRAGLR